MVRSDLPRDNSRALTVLVVDDDRVIVETLVRILNGHGFHARGADSGAEAIECASSTQLDVVIVEAMMPQMSGIEASIMIRRLLPRCIVLVMSGDPGTADLLAEAQKSSHEFEVYAKPTNPGILIKRLGEIQASLGMLEAEPEL